MNESLRPICIVMWVCLVVPLAGCLEKKYYPQLDVLGGVFSTPAGAFDIDPYSDADIDDSNYILYNQDSAPDLYVYGRDQYTFVTIGVLPQHTGVAIISDKRLPYIFELESNRYSFNGNDVDFGVRLADQPSSMSKKRTLFITLPKPLAAIDTRGSGGSLGSSTVNAIKSGEDDIHRFVFDFSLDGEPYQIDFSFKVKLGTRWTIGVPGMP